MKILGHNYRIRYYPLAEDGGRDTAASIMTGKQQIFVDSLMHKQGQETAVLHEIIEGLNYHLELGLEHSKIAALEAGLYQSLCENGVKMGVLLHELEKKGC